MTAKKGRRARLGEDLKHEPGVALSPGLAERYGAARECIHCKIGAEDRPGTVCLSAHGPVQCSEPAPLYAKALGAHVREAAPSPSRTKQVAR
ncbi:MAG: hypothetical protein V2I27_04915 [Erythrobacter sp.]|jgi:hypothetical protein|nr:hypothetical protein [Erythrobacter sp.]